MNLRRVIVNRTPLFHEEPKGERKALADCTTACILLEGMARWNRPCLCVPAEPGKQATTLFSIWGQGIIVSCNCY
jgi:hypothetical protein